MSGADSNFAAERAELQAVLDSGIFARSPNLQKFLVFVCEKYFSGAVDEVKEYLVAVEALGRPPDFDQKRDSIVRVEAYRLRKRLDEYYRGPGSAHALRIQLASGSYVPQFVPRDNGRAAGASPIGSSESLPGHHTSSGVDASLESMEPMAAQDLGRASNTALVEPVEGPPGLILAADSRSGPTMRGRGVVGIFAALLILSAIAFVYWFRDRGASAARTPAEFSEGLQTTGAGDASLAAIPMGTVDQPQAIRILAGSPFSSYVDRFGNTWTGDAYYEGGTAVENKLPSLHFTALPELYQHRREGQFSYSIPLAKGSYELHLHFAEPIFGEHNLAGGGETSRLFEVSVNGKSLLREFDILADAFGARNADVKVFKDIGPGPDGRLRLDFQPGMHESPIVSALELIPSEPGRIHPVRIVANERGFTDNRGHYWNSDHFVHGGRFVRRNPITHPEFDGSLFQGERYGNFTYMIPVATNGKYRVRLYFCERWWGPDTHAGGGAGSRRFDVFLNGKVLLADFDIFREAGGNDKPIVREFSGIAPNVQGKLILQFVPRQNYAMLNALEVLDESP